MHMPPSIGSLITLNDMHMYMCRCPWIIECMSNVNCICNESDDMVPYRDSRRSKASEVLFVIALVPSSNRYSNVDIHLRSRYGL